MQILFITVCDTSGTWIRKQLFYFISVITFQQISFTFQFGRENSDFLSISSPLTVSQQRALLVLSPSTAISYTKLHILTFIAREHAALLVFTAICSPHSIAGRMQGCSAAVIAPLRATSRQRCWMHTTGSSCLPPLLLAHVLFAGGLWLCRSICFTAKESTLPSAAAYRAGGMGALQAA